MTAHWCKFGVKGTFQTIQKPGKSFIYAGFRDFQGNVSLYSWYKFHVNFMYLLQCLKVFLTDSFRLRDEVHRPPAVHHTFSDMNVQFYSVFSAYFSEILQLSDHNFSGAIKGVQSSSLSAYTQRTCPIIARIKIQLCSMFIPSSKFFVFTVSPCLFTSISEIAVLHNQSPQRSVPLKTYKCSLSGIL